MKYWLLTSEYPPQHGGGISTYSYFTALMMHEAGHAVTVFIADDTVSDYTLSESAEGATLVRFNTNRNKLESTLGYTARMSYAFAHVVKDVIEVNGKPDFIEAQDYLGVAYYLIQYKHLGYEFLQGIPIVITLHSPAFIYLEYNGVSTYSFPDFWTGEMEKQSIIGADLLISPTEFLVHEIQKYINLHHKKIEILPNPYRADAKVNQSFTRNKIIYYGKLSPQKGSFQLLKYFDELWQKGFEHPLHIIGGTDIVYHPETQTMGQLVETRYEKYLSNGLLQLHGKISPFEMREALKDAHVVVVPSIVDNLPYVVMEAMSMGKVVLASVQGGQREMIEDGVSGFLFNHEIPGSFSKTLGKVLALSDDAVQSIGAQAKRYVNNLYGFDTILKRKVKLLKHFNDHFINESVTFPFVYQQPVKPLGKLSYKKDLLSVVIPFYNMGDYISSAVESILRSSYKNVEIVIVNDGSTLQTSLEALEAFSSYSNIRIVHQKNSGLSKTRNEGARIASGEYLAFLDADDQIDTLYFEKAIRALKRNENVFFVGCWVKYFENSSKIWPTFTPQPPYALVHNPINSSSLVYKRNAFLAGGLNDTNITDGLEDYESVISMLKNGFNGVVLPEPLFNYRVRSGSMFRKMTTVKLINANRYIAQKHRDYYQIHTAEIINILNANGPGYLFDNPTFEVSVTSTTRHENAIFHKMKSFIRKNERLKKIALAVKRMNSLLW